MKFAGGGIRPEMRSPRAGRDYPGSQATFYSWFKSDADCLTWLAKERWRAWFVCPACKGTGFWIIGPGYRRCTSCRRRVSVLSGTPLHRQRLGPLNLLEAAWLLTWQTQGASAKSLARALGVKYEAAWLVLHKFREVMHADLSSIQLTGIIEVDETFLGGGKGTAGKHAVVVCVERRKGGRARLVGVTSASAPQVLPIVQAAVPIPATIHTDANNIYQGLKGLGYRHKAYNIKALGQPAHVYLPVIHSVASGLKSWMMGVHYRTPKDKHLDYYLAECAWRFNLRGAANRGILLSCTPLPR